MTIGPVLNSRYGRFRLGVVMRALVLITAAVMAVATGAQAQSSWVYVTDGTGHITGLNNRSRTNAGNHKRAWFVRILARAFRDLIESKRDSQHW